MTSSLHLSCYLLRKSFQHYILVCTLRKHMSLEQSHCFNTWYMTGPLQYQFLKSATLCISMLSVLAHIVNGFLLQGQIQLIRMKSGVISSFFCVYVSRIAMDRLACSTSKCCCTCTGGSANAGQTFHCNSPGTRQLLKANRTSLNKDKSV